MQTFNEIYRLVKARKLAFLAVFFVTVLISYAILYALDFYPEPADTDPVELIDEALAAPTVAAEREVEIVNNPLPEKIIFDSLDREVKILNPVSSDIADLDEALLSGVVRHPDSADFSDAGNIFILGHSSYLPNVLNKNFQAFNGIQNLRWGDKIRVQSADTEYVYRVDKVYEAKASEVFVPATPGEAKLTLATCDVLGAKEDRYIVEATLVGEVSING